MLTCVQGYDNWSALVQMEEQNSQTPPCLHPVGGARGRPGGAVGGSRGSFQRKGKMMRGGSKERQRLPHPAPRQNKTKNQHTRYVHTYTRRLSKGAKKACVYARLQRGAKLGDSARHTRFLRAIPGLLRGVRIRGLRKTMRGWCESTACTQHIVD